VRNPSQIQGVSYKKNAAGANIPLESPTTKGIIAPSTTIGTANGSILSWFSSRASAPPKQNERRVNPFAVLRQGKKTAIVATVDAGTINIFRFAQGAFETGPWY
jgi:tRNA-splicing endonuclease subunit Sen54